MHLEEIKTTPSSKMDVNDGFDLDCDSREGGEGEREPTQAPSFAVSPSFALLAAASAQTPRATFDVPATAESLPSDVLWRLATLLPVRDLPEMMAVCRSWRRGFGAAIDVLAPSSLSCDDSGFSSASFLARRFPCLRSLDLSSVPAATATDAALVEPLAALTGLTRLSLRGCRRVTARGLARALSSLPRLRSLDLSGCVGLSRPPPDGSGAGGGGAGFAAALPAGSLAALAEFSADRIPGLGDGDVEALARALLRPSCSPSPSSLPASSPPSPSFPSSSAPCRGLVGLSLDGAGRLTGRGLAALSPPLAPSSRGPGSLERLSLAGCASLDDAGLAEGLAPFAASLTALVLDRCALVSGSGLAGAARCFPALRHLSARDSGVDDAGAAAAASSSGSDECRFPALEELVLDDCSALTDYGVEALAGRRERGAAAGMATAGADEGAGGGGGLPCLARLSLARLPRLEGWGLSPLFGSSPEIASLCLAGCVRLGDAAAQAVGGRGSRLQSLDVSDCERVGVGFCAGLGSAPLVRLRASRCPRLSPAAVEALGSGRAAETLEELEASGCAALVAAAGGDENAGGGGDVGGGGGNGGGGRGGGASAVAAALPNLRSLDLSATPLTLRGLEELLTTSVDGVSSLRLPRLASLNLACCPRLSRPAVQRLLLAASAASGSGGGGGGGLSVNSWGCKEEEEEGEKEEERPSIAVNSDSSSSPVLSFGHLSPQRGNRAAAAALASAA